MTNLFGERINPAMGRMYGELEEFRNIRYKYEGYRQNLSENIEIIESNQDNDNWKFLLRKIIYDLSVTSEELTNPICDYNNCINYIMSGIIDLRTPCPYHGGGAIEAVEYAKRKGDFYDIDVFIIIESEMRAVDKIVKRIYEIIESIMKEESNKCMYIDLAEILELSKSVTNKCHNVESGFVSLDQEFKEIFFGKDIYFEDGCYTEELVYYCENIEKIIFKVIGIEEIDNLISKNQIEAKEFFTIILNRELYNVTIKNIDFSNLIDSKEYEDLYERYEWWKNEKK